MTREAAPMIRDFVEGDMWRPKNRNSVKLKALKLLDSASSASSVAAKTKAPRVETVGVMQGSSENGFRASVFLAASAAGNKLESLLQFVPPGVTGVSQPMDVAVMKPFKDYV
eukprot:jgi/Phyca11/22030/fgenesh1_pg.PHYCAscaffold_436_\